MALALMVFPDRNLYGSRYLLIKKKMLFLNVV